MKEAGIGYQFKGWLGGYSDQEDRAQVTLELYDSGGTIVLTEVLPPITASDRDNETGLRSVARFGMVPPFVRSARVTIEFTRSSGYNDGYVDNLSLVLTAG